MGSDTPILGFNIEERTSDTINATGTDANGVYNGWGDFATATIEDGEIIMTDNVPGDSETSLNMYATPSNAGAISIPYFEEDSEGFTDQVSTSAVI